MVTAVQFLISKLLSPLWRRVEDEEDGLYCGGDIKEIHQVRGGVVTQLCQDYGLIDHSVYFTAGEVLGGVPLCVGDPVHALAVRDGAHEGWRALRVERQMDTWEGGGRASLDLDTNKLRPLIGTVSSCDKDGGFINRTTYFPRSALCQGFEPMKGDWVQAQYFISPTEWSSQAQTVAPLRYQRMDQVCVSSVFGRSGVVEDCVFFCLDSLLLPTAYQPTPGDVVSVVVVESSQSFYCWRALCMAPIKHSLNASVPVLPEAEMQILLQNKGGLVVSEETQFGSLLMGQTKELLIWIHNTGSETHTLKFCEFAGRDSAEQFTFGPILSPDTPSIPLKPKNHEAILQKNPFVPSFRAASRGLVGGHGFYPLLCLSNEAVEEKAEGNETDSEVDEDGEPKDDGEKDSGKTPALLSVERNLKIVPGEKVSVAVSCHAKNLGRCAELLLLHFSSFTIGRRLEVSVSSAEESLLKPSAPYCPAVPLPQPQRHAQVITVMAPAPPIRLARRRLPNFLGNYPVPQALRECVEAQNDVLVVQPALGEPLCLSSMIPRFSALLWLEELQAEKELKEFTISGALLRKGAVYLHLEVPGLSEGRPNLFIGDRVVLKKPCSGGCVVEYIGYVTEISEEDVSLRVNSEFQKSYLGEPLDVEFTFNRVTIRRCHCALEQTKHFGENVLFPRVLQLQSPIWTGKWEPEQLQVENEGEPPRQDKKGTEMAHESGQKQSSLTMDMVSVATQTKTDLHMPAKPIPNLGQFFNCNLNPAQKEAVKRILSGDCRPTPYVLFGPPGTGKTVTLIEAILQVYHRVPGSRLLVCTPSNSAADLICIRLHESGYLHAASLARVNATCRQEESIPDVLRQYSRAGEDVRHASFHRIVVSTCSSAGMFYQIGLRVGHFTHVFLDEAGQATEPESLIPLGLLSEKTGQVVLAGDPKQLGPIVKSKLAEAFGLGVSLLERLMAIALYSCNEKGYNPLLVTKLVYNYRSHEVLLSLPSRLFYGGELCVRSPRAVVDSLCHWSRLPTKGFPLMFHGVRGTEMRECSNPSWFNPGEAVQVMLYCCQLAKRLYNPIPANDIGIIAPYKKQVEKIRVLLQKVGLADIKVGSVEEFQGQEFLVIILSTVRSNEALPSGDLQSALGFLSNPKRFNVAITRPKALLIVIGNPHVLIKDPCFHALLQYTYENGAFLGCDPPVSLRVAHRAASKKE
ncbi:RNA helicase Mov10l1 isoform X1 [Pygocentrus nattereri]|uniref:RNA helicase n=1 Tax=Pygocentrus nattereri TaxID=42514 RepID=A0A3B4E4J3_PYGNA|nr:RNA helicase Mov10l1 isoform X1 [Pygocentrus nattereri]XP_017554883.1 RNA helicase Mov10l1 isoform X1 [Pygocentrus nattereri]